MARPRVFVLTDGSGRTNMSRVPSTRVVLEGAGATPGTIFGRFTDAAFYAAVLERDFPLFTALAGELARALVENQIDYVVGDAAEGYNPTHDVCRLLINAAIRIAARIREVPVANFEFALFGRPDPPEARPDVICLELGAAALQRKLGVAHDYVEMAGEVAAALNAWGAEAFGKESFRPVANGEVARQPEELPPYYERHGEERVSAGTYGRVIRYRDHVLPLAEALSRYADDTG